MTERPDRPAPAQDKPPAALTITSCLAANGEPAVRRITRYLGDQLGISAEFVGDISWEEREALLDAGKIHVGWTCGLLYVWKVAQLARPIELLAAPVMRGERYGGQPVYFSDVVVRRDSPFHSFADLRGASWAYNENRSYSGYYVVVHHLAALGETDSYFGRTVASGAHQASLQMVLAGEVDATAIDSTALDLERQQQPALRSQIRVVAELGPSPVPPWVIFGRLPAGQRQELRQLLLHMHEEPEGRAILAQGQLARFAAVTDADYDPIRAVVRQAEPVRL